MRKPRDYDSELKALSDKAKQLKERRVRQLGELVTATGADALDADLLAGALLEAADAKDEATKEGWRRRGATFFQNNTRKPAQSAERRPRNVPTHIGGAAST
ncbi:MAG: conjugal transfer protein TraD [Sphingobium sp.]|nr:conjugal transfer protein TraD [Sphingobium sp.]